MNIYSFLVLTPLVFASVPFLLSSSPDRLSNYLSECQDRHLEGANLEKFGRRKYSDFSKELLRKKIAKAWISSVQGKDFGGKAMYVRPSHGFLKVTVFLKKNRRVRKLKFSAACQAVVEEPVIDDDVLDIIRNHMAPTSPAQPPPPPQTSPSSSPAQPEPQPASQPASIPDTTNSVPSESNPNPLSNQSVPPQQTPPQSQSSATSLPGRTPSGSADSTNPLKRSSSLNSVHTPRARRSDKGNDFVIREVDKAIGGQVSEHRSRNGKDRSPDIQVDEDETTEIEGISSTTEEGSDEEYEDSSTSEDESTLRKSAKRVTFANDVKNNERKSGSYSRKRSASNSITISNSGEEKTSDAAVPATPRPGFTRHDLSKSTSADENDRIVVTDIGTSGISSNPEVIVTSPPPPNPSSGPIIDDESEHGSNSTSSTESDDGVANENIDLPPIDTEL
jgi:hypothetical protein